MNLIELMRKIRDRPEAFLQDDCILQLRAFIRGFILAKNTSIESENTAICEDHKLLDRFDSYVKEKYKIELSERISVEEVLLDTEGKNAYPKYIELWFNYVQH
jgi:hypothetical protein